MIEIYQTIWAETKYAILAKNKIEYEDICELIKEENYSVAYPLIDKIMNKDMDFDNYKEAAQEVWGHFKNKERDNSHFFASLNNQNENMRLLWRLNLLYQPVFLLNCRIFFKENNWNKAWVIKNNKIRLFMWEREKYYRLKLPEAMIKRIAKIPDVTEFNKDETKLLRKALVLVTVDGTEIINPKLIYAINNGLEIN